MPTVTYIAAGNLFKRSYQTSAQMSHWVSLLKNAGHTVVDTDYRPTASTADICVGGRLAVICHYVRGFLKRT